MAERVHRERGRDRESREGRGEEGEGRDGGGRHRQPDNQASNAQTVHVANSTKSKINMLHFD